MDGSKLDSQLDIVVQTHADAESLIKKDADDELYGGQHKTLRKYSFILIYVNAFFILVGTMLLPFDPKPASFIFLSVQSGGYGIMWTFQLLQDSKYIQNALCISVACTVFTGLTCFLSVPAVFGAHLGVYDLPEDTFNFLNYAFIPLQSATSVWFIGGRTTEEICRFFSTVNYVWCGPLRSQDDSEKVFEDQVSHEQSMQLRMLFLLTISSFATLLYWEERLPRTAQMSLKSSSIIGLCGMISMLWLSPPGVSTKRYRVRFNVPKLCMVGSGGLMTFAAGSVLYTVSQNVLG